MTTKRHAALKTAHSVDGIDALASLILLPLHPMSIKIREQSIDIICAGSVAIPFLSIVTQ